MSIFNFLPQFASADLSQNPPKLTRRRALLGISALAVTACSRSGNESTANKPTDNGGIYYTCSMHPFVHSLDPHGKCPVCGMDLIPVHAPAVAPDAMKKDYDKDSLKAMDEMSGPTNSVAQPTPAPDASGIVQIAPNRLQEIGATTEVVTKRALTRTLKAPARAEIDRSTMRDINVKAGGGYITKLYANSEGLTFRKGQPLMTVLCENWLDIQVDYIKAYRDWRRTPSMTANNYIALENKLYLTRARIRVWDLSEGQLHDLEKFAISTNELDLRTGRGLSGSFDILAPFDCYIHEDKAVEGMKFEAGQSLLTLADHSKVWVVAQFPEDQAMFLDLGQQFTVTFPSMPQHKITGKVSFIDPHVDEEQRRIMARIELSDSGHMIHPGLFAEVSGEVPMGDALTISASALVPTGNKFIAFVDHGGGKLEPRQIEVGVRSGDYFEVVSGLKEGDHVVTGANFLIDAESRIQGVLKTWGDRQ